MLKTAGRAEDMYAAHGSLRRRTERACISATEFFRRQRSATKGSGRIHFVQPEAWKGRVAAVLDRAFNTRTCRVTAGAKAKDRHALHASRILVRSIRSLSDLVLRWYLKHGVAVSVFAQEPVTLMTRVASSFPAW